MRLKKKATRGIDYILSRGPIVRHLYWRYSPQYYRWSISRKLDHEAPLNPLKIAWVDPSDISEFSGRKDAIKDRYKDLGKVCGGEWDISAQERTGRCTHRIEETPLYSAFADRYINGKKWEETALIQNNTNRSRKTIDQFSKYDEIFQSIKSHGYKTQSEIINEGGLGANHTGFLDTLTNEITVDIGRDGKLLFVDGRHRLCIAKILQLESIPVTFLVRHEMWMQKREKLFQNQTYDSDSIHPDLVEVLHSKGRTEV